MRYRPPGRVPMIGVNRTTAPEPRAPSPEPPRRVPMIRVNRTTAIATIALSLGAGGLALFAQAPTPAPPGAAQGPAAPGGGGARGGGVAGGRGAVDPAGADFLKRPPVV